MKTARLELRLLKKSDYTSWKKAKGAQAQMKSRFDSAPASAKDLTRSKFYELLREQAKKRKADYAYVYGVFREDNLVGSVTIGGIQRGATHSATIGYQIFNNHWSKGYGTEAVGGLLEIAFKEQKLHRVVAGIEPGNDRSVKIVRKFRFRREGFSKRVVLLRGEWKDLIQYALTCEDYGIVWQG